MMPQCSDSPACFPPRRQCNVRRPHFESLEVRRLLAPLVGVDFDSVANNGPAGWQSVTSLTTPQLRENLGGTEIDLSVRSLQAPPEVLFVAGNIDPVSLPLESSLADLHKLDGSAFADEQRTDHLEREIDAAWLGLKSGFTYEVYVFGLLDAPEGSSSLLSINQHVSITGNGGSVVGFSQSYQPDGKLIVNRTVGDSGTPLEDLAELIQPDQFGHISLLVRGSFVESEVALGGLAIRERGIVVNDLGVDNDGDINNSVMTLPEAIALANATTGADTIVFDPSLSGQSIHLSGTALSITDAVTVDARGLAEDLTIDAGGMSRIFHITSGGGDVALAGLNLTGGRTIGDNVDEHDHTYSGGAVLSKSTDRLTIIDSEISGNSVSGANAGGGGLFTVGALSLSNSLVSGNSTSGYFGYGGAIFADDGITITDSHIENNHTAGNRGQGGALFARGAVSIRNTTFGHNFTTGNTSQGGAIYFDGNMTLVDSSVSGNRTEQDFGNGGGIRGFGTLTINRSTIDSNSTSGYRSAGAGADVGGDVIITRSTISRNLADGTDISGGGISAGLSLTISDSTVSGNHLTGMGTDGGGLFAGTDLTIHRTTITDNSALGSNGRGGGVIGFGDILIEGSVIAGNQSGLTGPDLQQVFMGALTVNFSLIGDADGRSITGNGNTIGDRAGSGLVDPQLGPLQNNGSRCATHLPLPGSPLIDRGDATFTGPPGYDQRGFAFDRVVDGRIDIGAVEYGAVSADFDSDGDVDGYDFIQWQLGFGLNSTVAHSEGDADVNGIVEGRDLEIIEAAFGQASVPMSESSSNNTTSLRAGPTPAVDLAPVLSGQDRRQLADLVDLAMAMASERPIRKPWHSRLLQEASNVVGAALPHTMLVGLSGLPQRVAARALPVGTVNRGSVESTSALDLSFARAGDSSQDLITAIFD